MCSLATLGARAGDGACALRAVNCRKEKSMTIATIEAKKTKRTPVPLNGVDTPTLISTINAVGAKPELAKFTFRNSNEWISGTHSRSTMKGFYGAGGEHAHKASYSAESDHPAVLCGAGWRGYDIFWWLTRLGKLSDRPKDAAHLQKA